jgi:8-oxo-dGTP pyrophosphatase MutT (NUDIX family)
MEVIVPIVVKHFHIQSCTTGAVQFYNTVVSNCIPYTKIDVGTYKRNIQRSIINEYVTWPPHPMNQYNRIFGSIVLIKSKDDMYLLIRNGNLWGLPKGARNYHSYIQCKAITDKHYLDTGDIYIHESLTISNAESNIDNAIRETMEETSIVIDPNYLVEYQSDDISYTAYERYVYYYQHTVSEFDDTFDQSNMDSENDMLQWFSLVDLKQMIKQKKLFNQVSIRFLTEFLC